MEATVPAVMCSICCEEKPPVELCTCNAMEDKRICEDCAVALHDGCGNMMCNCYGYKCAFCRATDKTPKAWTENSAKYWKRRATDLAARLEECAVEITVRDTEVIRMRVQQHALNRQLSGGTNGVHLFMNQ